MQNGAKIMFTGNKTHKLDPKGRITLPAEWRLTPGALLMLMAVESTEKLEPVAGAKPKGKPIMRVYTRSSFDEMIGMVRTKSEALNASYARINHYVGKITRLAAELEVNSQCKILIPKSRRDEMGLTDSLVVVGCDGYFELWAPNDYDVFYGDDAPNEQFDALNEHFGIL